jgi:hypothetical protein
MIPLWKGKNPIYFGVITIIPFDNLYRRAYFVMHTFLVFNGKKNCLKRKSNNLGGKFFSGSGGNAKQRKFYFRP